MSSDAFELKEVSKNFVRREGALGGGRPFAAVSSVDFKLARGGYYGLVGESGSGKSTLAKLLVGLLAPSGGEILFEGRPVTEYINHDQTLFRQKVQMIFQNPYLSLDPKWKVNEIINEGIRFLPRKERRFRIGEALERVRLDPSLLSRKPHEMSGGERQRVALARALVMRPEYLILDEPSSSLDVSVQAEIIELLKSLRTDFQGGLLFITHDIALATQIADDLIVMRHGRIVEMSNKRAIVNSPREAYTSALLAAVHRKPDSWGGSA